MDCVRYVCEGKQKTVLTWQVYNVIYMQIGCGANRLHMRTEFKFCATLLFSVFRKVLRVNNVVKNLSIVELFF